MKLGFGANIKSSIHHDNYSLDFDGVDQYITMDGAASSINGAVGTISAWVKLHTTSSGCMVLRTQVNTTTDNSSYDTATQGSETITHTTSSDSYAHNNSWFIFDVTNTTNCKCSFSSTVSNDSVSTAGNSGLNRTYATFIRLGDT